MTPISSIVDPRERLLAFAREREAIRIRRMRGWPGGLPDGWEGPVPGYEVWTLDPILAMYRFTNVRKEDDRVSRWIADNWRTPHAGDPDLWFALLVSRFVNWPDTLAEIGYPVPWRPAHFLRVMDQRKRERKKLYSGAYMIRADSGTPGRATAEYQEAEMFTPMWENRRNLRPRPGDTLNSYHVLLGQLFGLGSFMAAQVVGDLKYALPLSQASDWWSFAASGPGSRRGLNIVMGRPINSPWTEEDWRMEAERLMTWFNQQWTSTGGEPLHGQDFQNCLCEASKYEKVRLGLGRPRARFP